MTFLLGIGLFSCISCIFKSSLKCPDKEGHLHTSVQSIIIMSKAPKILTISSTTLTLICLAFLIYQTTKCTFKFIDGKKGTDVSIADASKQTYPAITICPLIIYSENPAYVDNLQKCNLNPQEYFDEAKWVGTGDPAYCKDPANLYEKVVGNASSIIYKIEVDGSTDRGFLASEIEFIFLDHPELMGRCFSVPLPKDVEMTRIYIEGINEIDVKFHAPGNYYDPDYKYIHVQPGTSKDVDLNNEIFNVLDYDGHECENYLGNVTRDACIIEYMTLKSVEALGCTTPYLTDKSNICTDQEKALQANDLYRDLKEMAYKDAIPECPKPCQNLMIDFGRSSETVIENPEAPLLIRLRKYIKVSTVSYTYQGLELFAEVGGYMGLFLGISLSQLPALIADLVQKFQFKK